MRASQFERKLTGGEKRSKEAHFKKLKKHKKDFVDRYGDEGEGIMHAIATKRAKGESVMKDDANTFKKGASDAEMAARTAVRLHNKIDAKLANTPSIAKTQQYKDYKKGNQQRKIAAMKKGMPYGRQDGPGTGANSKPGGALKPIPGLK
tara:strand:- start:30 stop:476 length:447 start_codon:yes stop_codon:yes gene_type:complete